MLPGGPQDHHDLDERLTGLFQAYREAVPDPEPDVNFMPVLWQKIDANQTVTISLRRWAQALVTAAAAICLLMTLYLAKPYSSQPSIVYSASYLDTLADASSSDRLDAFVEISDADGIVLSVQ
jgi:hypothetical protein